MKIKEVGLIFTFILISNLFSISLYSYVYLLHDSENLYVPIDTLDWNTFNYIGSATQDGYVILNPYAGLSYETNVSQISEDWNHTIPFEAIALNIRLSAFSTELAANYVEVMPNGNNHSVMVVPITTNVESLRIDECGIVGIGYNTSIMININHANGSIVFWFSILGYFL